MLISKLISGAACALALAAAGPAVAQVASPTLNRTVLPIPAPIPTPIPTPITTLDARDAKAPPRFEVTAPKGAPNVVIILIDDMGFGMPNTFGGPINMPVMDQLSKQGLKFNRFHTTALCSPSRMALLTGQNHHANNAGAIMELATAFPGNTGIRPQTITPVAEILRQNGYSTAAFGKYHETPPWEVSVSGPMTRWPTNSGFDKFYGFIGGETNQWAPALYDGVTRIEPPHDPNYHFTTDMTNQAINWVSAQQSLTPEKPFFMYFAPGATHAPHHVPREWADKYKGKFAMGWDKLREETLARQKALGVVPPDTMLTVRPKEIPAWNSLTPIQKKLFERQMEVFAGFAEHTDHEVGRLVDQLRSLGVLDNTLFFYIAGDNGASAEGGPDGTDNEMMALNGVVQTADKMVDKIDRWGDPSTYPHFSIGWALAANTPYQWTKQVASHLGGTRVGMVVRWPKGVTANGEIRSQFEHLIDVAPTILDAAGLPQPTTVNGIVQRPMDGVSMLPAMKDAKSQETRITQYFEMFGNRALYHDGWIASTRHSIPWLGAAKLPPVKDDVWELYDLRSDFSQSRNVAAKYPERLKELQALFDREAVRNNVYPIDDRRSERFNPAIAGRPDLMGGRKSLTVYPGMHGMMENAFINVKSVAHVITAEIEVNDAATKGVILAQAGAFGGWTLYMKDGRPHHEFNWFGQERTNIAGTAPLAPGKHIVTYQFIPDAAKPGTGGKSILKVDGLTVAEGHIPRTEPYAFSGDEGADVGQDGETPVSNDYKQGDNAFTGRIVKVTIEQK